VSFTFSNDKITIFVPDPADLVLESRTEIEVNMPLIEVVASYSTHQKLACRLGFGRTLMPPTAVTRSGLDTDLIIGINFDGSSTTALPPPDGAYCQLSWRVNSNPRSLRFATAAATAAASHPPLIVKPKRHDYQ
jgi:hypothetical protein